MVFRSGFGLILAFGFFTQIRIPPDNPKYLAELSRTGLPQNYRLQVWIGMFYDYVSGVWKWTDGSASAFTYWAPGEPAYDAGRNNTNCVQMMPDANPWAVRPPLPGMWNDVGCDVLMRVSDCKKPANTS